MGKHEKLIQRLLACPTDFTYLEVKTLLGHLGYEEMNKGKTSGSRVEFWRRTDNHKISLHKPHPSNILKHYQIVQLIENLRNNGDIV